MQRLSGHPFEPWFLDRLASARSIALMTHIGPDADGLGCQIAFAIAARRAGVAVAIVNEDPIPARYSWLDPDGLAGSFDRDGDHLAQADLGLMFDAHEIERAGRPARRLRELGRPVWVVDHHNVSPDEDVQGAVATQFSSCGELTFRLLQALGWPIDAAVARPLYAAMSFDTGSFRFLRNQPDTLRVAADLLATGLDANPIQEALFASKPRSEVELLGRVLARMHFSPDGRVAYAVLEAEVTDGLDVAPDAIGETIPHLIGIDGVLVAMQIKPGRKSGEWKLSLRSKAAVRIGSVARRFGGGGHEHAAGATMVGDPHLLAAEILADLQAAVDQQVGPVVAEPGQVRQKSR